MKGVNHAAVFVNDEPSILCGPSNDPASIAEAEALADSQQIQAALLAAGMSGYIWSAIGLNVSTNL